MTVNTKTVEGRREVRYATFEELLADAERLATGEARTIGNWSLGQIFRHLAKSIHASIDGAGFRAPWIIRVVARTFMKNKFINKGMSSGFAMPEKAKPQFYPEEVDPQTGLSELREAVERVTTETRRAENMLLGQLSQEDSDQFHLRHAEMHMSFAVPVE